MFRIIRDISRRLRKRQSDDSTDSTIQPALVSSFTPSPTLSARVATQALAALVFLCFSPLIRSATPPANDLFQNRILLSGETIRTTGSNVGAGKEPGEPNHGQPSNRGGKSVWWEWTAPFGGQATISTKGSSFETILSIYTNSSLTSLAFVTGNNLDETDPDPTAITSRADFTAIAGVRYQIAVDGFYSVAFNSTDEGQIQLSVDLVPVPLIAIKSPRDGTTFRKPQSPEVCIEASSTKSAVAKIELFEGTNRVAFLTPPKPLPSVDACLTWTNAPTGTHALTARVTDVLGQVAESGPLKIQVEIGNDNFDARQKLTGRSVQITGSNFSASKEPFETDPLFRHPFNEGGRSVWYEWTCPSAGIVRLNFIFDELNSQGLLMIFTGNSKTSLKKIASNLNPYEPLLVFTNDVPGTTFQISVDGLRLPNGTTEASFSLDLRVSQPPSIQVDNPLHQTVFTVGTSNLVFSARVQDPDPDDFVAKVSYFLQPSLGGAAIPIGSVSLAQRNPRYLLSTNSLPEGKYAVFAVATDNLGYSTTSTNDLSLSVVVPPLVPLWSYDLGAETAVFSPAIGRDGTIYIGTSSGSFHAITQDGKPKWPAPFRTPGPIESSAAVAEDGTVYVGGGDLQLHALNPDGSEKWAFRVGHYLSATPSIGSDGTIFIGSWNRNFYAINPRTGGTNWVRNLGTREIFHSAAIGQDGIIYISGPGTNVAYALRPQDGSILWTLKSPDEGDFGSAIIGRNNSIYWQSYGKLFEVNPQGRFLWTNQFFAASRTPILDADGTIYFSDGLLKAFNGDGSVKSGWKVPTTDWTRSIPAVASDGSIYLTDSSGALFGLRPDSIEPLVFRPPKPSTNASASSNESASPALGVDGTIYYAAGTRLYALKGTGAGLANSPWPKHHRNARQTGNIQDSPGDHLWEISTISKYSSLTPTLGTDGTIYYNTDDSLRAVSPDGRLKWSFKGTANGDWSPVIQSDGTILILANQPGLEPRLVRLNPDGSVNSFFPAQYSGYATPAIASDGTIYMTGLQRLHAHSPAGEARWTFRASTANGESWSSPAIGPDGTVYYGIESTESDRGLYAVNPLNGQLKWFHHSENQVYSSPAIGRDGTVYYAVNESGAGILYAVDSTSGKTRWRAEGPGIGQSSPVIGPDGTVFLGSTSSGVYAVNPDGTVKWKQRDGTYVRSTPVLGNDGILYAGTESGTVMAVNMETGRTVWEILVSSQGFGGHSGTLGVDGTLFITDSTGKLHAIKTTSRLAISPWPKFHRDAGQTGSGQSRDGDTIWSYNDPGRSYFPPAIAPNGNVYYSVWGRMHVVSGTNGVPMESRDENGDVTSGISMDSDGTAYFSRSDGNLYALNQDLTVKWKTPIGDTGLYLQTPAQGTNGMVFFWSGTGFLLAIDSQTGAVRWKFDNQTPPLSSPVVGVDGTIYLLSKEKLTAVRDDGTLKWLLALPAEAYRAVPAISPDGTIYFGLDDTRVYAVRDAGDKGTFLGGAWPFKSESLVRNSPVIGADGTIYLAPGGGFAYAIRPDGSLKSSFKLPGNFNYSYVHPALSAPSTLILCTGDVDSSVNQSRMLAIDMSRPQGSIVWDLPVPPPSPAAAPVIGSDGTIFLTLFSGELIAVRGTPTPSKAGWPQFMRDALHSGNAGTILGLPSVTLASPAGGSRFSAPATLKLTATATARSGSIAKVEFLANNVLLKSLSEPPFSYSWQFVPEGNYQLTARVTDSTGQSAISKTIPVVVVAPSVPRNDNFASRDFLGDATRVATNASNALATQEKGEPLHAGRSGERSVWWTWHSPAKGRVHLSTLGSTFDTLLAVYAGTQLDTLREIASDDDSAGGGTSEVHFNTEAGRDYQIAVAGFGRSSGDIQLSLKFNTAPTISLVKPASNSQFVGNNTPVLLEASATDFEGGIASVEFFDGASSIGSSTNSPFRLSWNPSIGNHVLTAVATDLEGLGSTATPVTILVLPAPPVNDNRTSATPLFGPRASDEVSTLGATREVGEPDHAGRTGGKSAWWTWTAPFNGDVLLSTRGSTFDTLLAVYTSTSSGLHLVASDDDSGGDGTSELKFPASEGATFFIAVDGFSGKSGLARLSLSQNVLPTVELISPGNGETGFLAPASILIKSKATDEDGQVDHVDFYESANLIGSTSERQNNTFSINWNNVAAGKYTITARATDDSGNVRTSTAVAIEVKGVISPPRITSQPLDITQPPGGQASFAVKVIGTPPFGFQWRFNGQPITSATNISLALPNLSSALAGVYDITISNAAGRVTSIGANLKIAPLPEILTQPASVSVQAGESAMLSVIATNGSPLRYQWMLNGAPIPSATNNVLRLVDVTPSDEGSFSVRVGNEAGVVGSRSARITVQAVPKPGELPLSPREDFWVPNGPVHALLRTNGLLYVGGRFDYVGPNTGHGIELTSAGDTVRGFPRIDGNVLAAISDGSGGWFIGGVFTTVGGIPRSNLVHILQDHSVDPGWNPSPNGQVLALVMLGRNLYVGGQFTSISGSQRNNLASLEASTGQTTPWAPDPDGRIQSLAVSDRFIYAGGQFGKAGGRPVKILAQFTTEDSVPTRWNPDVNGSVLAIATDGPMVYVGGEFSRAGGLARNGIAALDQITANAAPGWNPDAGDRAVRSLLVKNGLVFAGGDFLEIGGKATPFLAAIDGNGRAKDGWSSGLNNSVDCLAASESQLFAGGNFTLSDETERHRLAAFELKSGNLTEWNPGAGGRVEIVAVAGEQIFVGGNFTSIGGRARKNLAAFDEAAGDATDWHPDPDNSVASLAAIGNWILIGGEFTGISGKSRGFLAAVDAATGQLSNWDPKLDDFVSSMAVAGSTLFAVGNFQHASGQSRGRGAAFEAPAFTLTPWNPAADQPIRDLALKGNQLYLAGDFTRLGDAPYRYIAQTDLLRGLPTDWKSIVRGTVSRVTAGNNLLFVAGNFSEIGGVQRNKVAAIQYQNGDASDAWNPSIAGESKLGVNAIAVTDELVFLGGRFESISSKTRVNIAALSATTGGPDPWRPKADGSVLAIAALSRASVVAGGEFTSVDGRFQPFLAVFAPRGLPAIVEGPESKVAASGTSVALQVSAIGTEPLRYQWFRNEALIGSATNEVLNLVNVQATDAGNYRVVVSNAFGFAVSGTSKVQVLAPPVIVPPQPRSQRIAAGSDITLEVKAEGSAPISYQWLRNGISIQGGTNAQLQLRSFQPTDSGSYRAIVSNGAGSIGSTPALIEVVSTGSLILTDNFADRKFSSAFEGNAAGNNQSATREPREPSHARKNGDHSLWLGWRAPANGIVTFDTIGSDFDTLLAVYTGNTISELGSNEVASDEDSGGFFTSLLKFNAVQGTEYQIAVDGFAGSTGNALLHWRLESTSEEIPRIVGIDPGSQSVARLGEKATFRVRLDREGAFTYQWFLNDQPISGATSPELIIGSVRSADLGGYHVEITSGPRIIRSDKSVLEIGPVATAFTVDKFGDLVQGPSNGFSVQSGSFKKQAIVSPVSAGIPGRQIFNNYGSTTEIDEPIHGSVKADTTRYYSLYMNASGTLVVDTIGSDFDTYLEISTGTTLKNQVIRASDDNGAPDGIRSRKAIQVVQGETYQVMVSGTQGATGLALLNWKLGTPPTFTSQPATTNLLAGARLRLTATASGFPAPTLQWTWNGIDIPGETNATLNLVGVRPSDAGLYRVRAENFAGAARSQQAEVQILDVARPRISALNWTPDGRFSLQLESQAGGIHIIESSLNLVDWLPIFTNNAGTSLLQFNAQTPARVPVQFFRVVRPSQ